MHKSWHSLIVVNSIDPLQSTRVPKVTVTKKETFPSCKKRFFNCLLLFHKESHLNVFSKMSMADRGLGGVT